VPLTTPSVSGAAAGKSMDHDHYPDSYIRGILNTVKTIAMVGISPKDVRPSYFAFKYLLERGYRMIPVNPGQVGGDILGQPVYAKLADIPEPVDMWMCFAPVNTHWRSSRKRSPSNPSRR
jgi:predicted CoA-binding protein